MKYSSQGGNPEISVLMSCYNASRWLHEAINSILTQTFKNFEFILINDGSTDDTWNIIKSYRDKDNRIVAISKENTGLSDSLNVGIAQAKGIWIARLDADDICESTRLEKQVSFLRNHSEVVLLGSGFFEIDEQGLVIKKNYYPCNHRKLVQHLEHLKRFFAHSTAIFRLEEVRKAKGYNVRFIRAQDFPLWLNLAMIGKIACIPKPLVRVRKHSNQMSFFDNNKYQYCEGIAALVCYFLRKAGFNNPSSSENTEDWIIFCRWIEKRIEETGAFRRRKAWAEARSEFFSSKIRLNGAFRFGVCLIKSGYTIALVWEFLFGISFPKQFAIEWMNRSPTTK